LSEIVSVLSSDDMIRVEMESSATVATNNNNTKNNYDAINSFDILVLFTKSVVDLSVNIPDNSKLGNQILSKARWFNDAEEE